MLTDFCCSKTEINERDETVFEPAHGKCSCGETVYLMGGDEECPNCGQWYNGFGQKITSPTSLMPETDGD